MEIQDEGTILSVRRFGETSAIVTLFTPRHGILRGLVKGAMSKSKRGQLQPGNLAAAVWRARLSEQLGTLALEPLREVAAHLIGDGARLALFTSAASLMETYLPEREAHPALCSTFLRFVEACLGQQNDVWEAYIQLEIQLLTDGGFGLDLTECALTGRQDNLTHVSPKSGRAACAEAAAPYAERLLRLPAFLTKSGNAAPSVAELLDALALSGYFLHHWLAEAAHRPLPPARARLSAWLPNPERVA